MPGQDGPCPALVLVPQEEFTIDQSSWNVVGMRGTGSKNVVLEDVFVPEHRFMDWARPQTGGRHPDGSNDGSIYRYPLNSAFAISVAAPTLGTAATVRNLCRDRQGPGRLGHRAGAGAGPHRPDRGCLRRGDHEPLL